MSKTALGLNRKNVFSIIKWKHSPGFKHTWSDLKILSQKTTVFKVLLCIETLSLPHQRVLMTSLGEHNRSVSTRREEVVRYVAGWKAESVMWHAASDHQRYSQFKLNGETLHSRSVFSLKMSVVLCKWFLHTNYIWYSGHADFLSILAKK